MSCVPALSAERLRILRTSKRSRFELRVDRLEIFGGHALAILGANGAGKTSLLRALAGLEPPVEGTISAHADGPVTMVFQRPIAFAGTVAHNVRTALLSLRLPSELEQDRIQQALQRFDVAHLIERRAASLSGGELRRVALARAFALQPAVLLLDEPFDDLDAAGREVLSLDLRGAIEDTGVAVAVVTHDLRRAVLLADRMAVLDAGCVQQIDDTPTVMEKPQNAGVARLVGMTNLIPGVVSDSTESGHAIVEIDREHRIETLSELERGTAVWVGIRSEYLKIDTGRGESAPIGKGVVRQILSDGVLSTLVIEWAGFELRTHLISGRGLSRSLVQGDAVLVSVQPRDVWLMRRDP
ncbi:MAG: ABC transporter ATP-binding protein [bacterium]|nr:ABC transporter ATP-binding protein [bacterium]